MRVGSKHTCHTKYSEVKVDKLVTTYNNTTKSTINQFTKLLKSGIGHTNTVESTNTLKENAPSAQVQSMTV